MTKADLVDKVADAASLSRAEAEAVVNTVLDSIVGALKSGDKIELRGFGSFRLRMRRPRQGRNPKTGTRVDVPAKAVPYFKPGKELREMLNPPGGEGNAGGTDAQAPETPPSS
ncbi:MAG: integration host factor subunit beta [Acidobacteriota bacterium]|nr:integration host factor subunit beta [Acidobacteriota bacterium]